MNSNSNSNFNLNRNTVDNEDNQHSNFQDKILGATDINEEDLSEADENPEMLLVINSTNSPLQEIEEDYAEFYTENFMTDNQYLFDDGIPFTLSNIQKCIVYVDKPPIKNNHQFELMERCTRRKIPIVYRQWFGKDKHSQMHPCRSLF